MPFSISGVISKQATVEWKGGLAAVEKYQHGQASQEIHQMGSISLSAILIATLCKTPLYSGGQDEIKTLISAPVPSPGHHRECCGPERQWMGKKHATVNYVLTTALSPLCLSPPDHGGDDRSGYKVSPEWWELTYRGKTCPAYPELKEEAFEHPIYPEHQDTYLQECLDNLAERDLV